MNETDSSLKKGNANDLWRECCEDLKEIVSTKMNTSFLWSVNAEKGEMNGVMKRGEEVIEVKVERRVSENEVELWSKKWKECMSEIIANERDNYTMSLSVENGKMDGVMKRGKEVIEIRWKGKGNETEADCNMKWKEYLKESVLNDNKNCMLSLN